MSVTVNPL